MARTAHVSNDDLADGVRKAREVAKVRLDGTSEYMTIEEALEVLSEHRDGAHRIWLEISIITEPPRTDG